jgi:hypothetical protein
VLAAVFLLILGALGAGIVDATAASADASVYTLIQNTPESWGPHWEYFSFVGAIDVDTEVTISCYLAQQDFDAPSITWALGRLATDAENFGTVDQNYGPDLPGLTPPPEAGNAQLILSAVATLAKDCPGAMGEAAELSS